MTGRQEFLSPHVGNSLQGARLWLHRGTWKLDGGVKGCKMLAILVASVVLGVQTPQILATGPENSANLWLSWSADGKWLAYTQIDLGDPPKFDAGKSFIVIVSPDGKKRRQLDGPGLNADFTSDGKSLIVRRGNGKNGQLFRYDIDGDRVTALTPAEGNNTTPACSPRADWVAFSSDRDGDDLQVFLMHKDGTGLKKLTHGPGQAFNPNWSADGKQITYYREIGDHKDQIYVMDADGSHERHISNPAEHNFYPAFLANGDISYTNMVGDQPRRSIIVDSEGKLKSVWMYDTAYMKWSPRGGRVAFLAGGFPKSAVYVARVDGRHPVRVSQEDDFGRVRITDDR
jgi:Tol biopolymer transport system component